MPIKKKTSVEKTEITPDHSPDKNFPIVGIGASAGGLAAFEAFFSGMPEDIDTDMAFVLVQHLAPDHKSILTDLIQRYTRMQVFEVEDGMVVKPNCAYIIPPNRDMALLNGTLQLLEPSAPRGQRLPIDFFFRSLAHDQRERAICIVLSGTGSDGTLGVRAIKGEGGLIIAQTPDSTEYDGMPQSAINTGLVDYILKPAMMPKQIMTYVSHAFKKAIQMPVTDTEIIKENSLNKIFILLRSHIGHDFSHYKPSTINRRIERRMAIQHIDKLDEYVRYLQQTPIEVESLFRDLLIGVTNFFRDKDSFTVLEEQIVPKLFASKKSGDYIRVWSTGCSTGEEAYSIAILLQEHMATIQQSFKVQIFATDIDRQAITTARAGIYPVSIANDIQPDRFKSFFEVEPDGNVCRINKNIRDMLIFSEQDVIKDPPFSKLDLISCRNLMIYLNVELQKKLIHLFHYALNPGGFLFLGTSETIGDNNDLFNVIDRKEKIYQRKQDTHGMEIIGMSNFIPPLTGMDMVRPQAEGKAVLLRKSSMRELTEQALMKQLIPSAALITNKGDILYIHGRTGMYLEPPQGDIGIINILKMAREGLQHELTTCLHKAVGTKKKVFCPGIKVKTNGDFTTVNLTISPVPPGYPAKQEEILYLVILEDAPLSNCVISDHVIQGSYHPSDVNEYIAALKQELRAKDEYAQVTKEELETSNEELKSSNEEMQSVNEELQSTNEELETSKEELQSVNEELATVNAELQNKVADLSCANNDMNNLLAGTGIGTVFVDHHMQILRFTPAVTKIINLIMADVDRPIGHIVSNFIGYDSLVEDIKGVLDTLVPKELEVQTIGGNYYTMRILPYRTLENVIEGAVITFASITMGLSG